MIVYLGDSKEFNIYIYIYISIIASEKVNSNYNFSLFKDYIMN